MNSKTIVSVVLISIVAVFLIVNILTGDGSNLGALAKYFAFMSFFLGVIVKKLGVYLLVIYGAFSDMIKRMLVLEGDFSKIDISFILMMSPFLMLGIFAGSLLDGVFKRDITRFQWLSLFLAVALGIVNFVMGGGVNGGVIGIMQRGANVVSYFFLPFCILRQYNSLEEYMKVIKFTVIVFLLVAIHGIGQGLFGYGGFEYKYLISGQTTITDWSDIHATRPFSTTASPASFAYVSGIIGVATFLLSWFRGKGRIDTGFKRITFNKWLALILTIFLVWGCLMSKSRGAILASLCTLPLFFLLKNLKLTVLSYGAALTTLITLFLSSAYILENDLLKSYQREVAPKIVEVTGIDGRYLTLATMHVRLEGWKNVVTNPEFQKPFGNRELVERMKGLDKQAKRRLDLKSHDMISSLLLNIGWVPLLFSSIIGGKILLSVNQVIARIPARTAESKCARVGLIALIAVYVTTLTGGAIAAFPVCLVANVLLCLTYLSVRDHRRELIQIVKDRKALEFVESSKSLLEGNSEEPLAAN